MSQTDLHAWLEMSKAQPQHEVSLGLNIADTWISPKYKYFCVAIPKTACSKTKLVLQQLEGYPIPTDPLRIHFRDNTDPFLPSGTDTGAGLSFVPSIADFSTPDAATILTSSDWFRFTFVRNPYSRLFSAYKSQVMDLESPYMGFRESIRQHAGYPTLPDPDLGMVGFADFVRYIAEQQDDRRDGHWKSQTGTLHLDRISYDTIGRVETFQRDFMAVLEQFDALPELVASLSDSLSTRVNTTVQLPLAAAYSKQLADLVYEIYVDDFETFGYDKNSWMFID